MPQLRPIGANRELIRQAIWACAMAEIRDEPPPDTVTLQRNGRPVQEPLPIVVLAYVIHLGKLQQRIQAKAFNPENLTADEAQGLVDLNQISEEMTRLPRCPKCKRPSRQELACEHCHAAMAPAPSKAGPPGKGAA